MSASTAVLLSIHSDSQAQTWQTIDDAEGSTGEGVREVTSDSAGNIFAAGWIRDASERYHAVITRSSDSGATWGTVADYPALNDPSAPNGPGAGFSAMAAADVAGGETVLVASGRDTRVLGNDYYLGVSGNWLTVRSKDAGVTWETVDKYSHPTYKTAFDPSSVAVDSSGSIYLMGAATENVVGKGGRVTTLSHWLIRKGLASAGGIVWSTVGDFSYPTSTVGGVVCVGTDVFAVGGGADSWLVRKSSDGGATWAVVDNYRLSSTGDSLPVRIAADATGNLYVVGSAGEVVTSGKGKTATTVTNRYWIVRKGTPGGSSWTTVDQFQIPNGGAQASAVTVDGINNVHVTGIAWSGPSSSLGHWITRQQSAVTGLWATTDDFSLALDRAASGVGITADPWGDLFSAGYANDSLGVHHGWIVRRKLAP